jgi:hypothetical protein
MARTAIAVIGAICLSTIAMTPAIGAKCTSIQAKCAVEAGGKCDPKTGHWCYGIYKGENCGGYGTAFRACLVRNGAAPNKRLAVISSGVNKCTSIQAKCAVELGGQCNPKTGAWCLGAPRGRICGGPQGDMSHMAFDACLSRKLGERK